MKDVSLGLALVVAALAAAIAWPLLGWLGAIPIGAVAFYCAAFIGSGLGYRRTIAWGAGTSLLIAAGIVAPQPAAAISYAAGAALGFAGMLSSAFRNWWFHE